MKQKVFCIIAQGFSAARNCLRPETAPFIILYIKRQLSCNFVKSFKNCHFMGHSGTDFKLLLNSKSSKMYHILVSQGLTS